MHGICNMPLQSCTSNILLRDFSVLILVKVSFEESLPSYIFVAVCSNETFKISLSNLLIFINSDCSVLDCPEAVIVCGFRVNLCDRFPVSPLFVSLLPSQKICFCLVLSCSSTPLGMSSGQPWPQQILLFVLCVQDIGMTAMFCLPGIISCIFIPCIFGPVVGRITKVVLSTPAWSEPKFLYLQLAL